MLEKLPDLVGHALRGQRAGLDKTAFQAVDLRGGMAALAVSSLAFADHAPIPERYTADGEGVSPPLQWGGVPAAAASLLLDRRGCRLADAAAAGPCDRGRPAPGRRRACRKRRLPSRENDGAGLQVGRNSYLQASWLPPDPPPGHGVHRYAFQVFALEAGADFDGEPGREAVLEAIRDHGLASGCLIGTYERPDTSIKVADEEGVPAMLPGTLAT